MSLITRVQRRGDIFFCKDNLKGPNTGHFYLIYSVSDGYRKPNMAFQMTSVSNDEKSLVKIILNQGIGKTPLLSKINPYGIYEIPDKEFSPNNYRGYISPEEECFRLIETLFLERFNPIKLWDGTNSTQFWLDDWNSRVEREFQKRSESGAIVKAPQNMVTFKSLSHVKQFERGGLVKSESHSVDVRIQDMDFFQSMNKGIFGIPNILKTGIKEQRVMFDVYREVIEAIQDSDPVFKKYLPQYDEIHSFGSTSKYARANDILVTTAQKRERHAIKYMMEAIPLPIFPVQQDSNTYTKNQIEGMSKKELSFLRWYLVKELKGKEITEEVRRELNYIDRLVGTK